MMRISRTRTIEIAKISCSFSSRRFTLCTRTLDGYLRAIQALIDDCSRDLQMDRLEAWRARMLLTDKYFADWVKRDLTI